MDSRLQNIGANPTDDSTLYESSKQGQIHTLSEDDMITVTGGWTSRRFLSAAKMHKLSVYISTTLDDLF